MCDRKPDLTMVCLFFRSCFILRIRGGDVSAVGRSGIEISLSHDTQKLEDYVAWQVRDYTTVSWQQSKRRQFDNFVILSLSRIFHIGCEAHFRPD